MSTTVWFPAPTASGPLYEARRERGLSRRQLAELSDVALRTIARIESGVGGPPKRATRLRLARALGCELAELADPDRDHLSVSRSESPVQTGCRRDRANIPVAESGAGR